MTLFSSLSLEQAINQSSHGFYILMGTTAGSQVEAQSCGNQDNKKVLNKIELW